jgi:hypothetical protein
VRLTPYFLPIYQPQLNCEQYLCAPNSVLSVESAENMFKNLRFNESSNNKRNPHSSMLPFSPDALATLTHKTNDKFSLDEKRFSVFPVIIFTYTSLFRFESENFLLSSINFHFASRLEAIEFILLKRCRRTGKKSQFDKRTWKSFKD